jgi:hypothetical protein
VRFAFVLTAGFVCNHHLRHGWCELRRASPSIRNVGALVSSVPVRNETALPA